MAWCDSLRSAVVLGVVALGAVGAPAARAQEAYFHVELENLELVDESPDSAQDGPSSRFAPNGLDIRNLGRVLLDGSGDAWLTPDTARGFGPELTGVTLSVRAPLSEVPVTGRVFGPGTGWRGYRTLRFTLDESLASDDHREAVLRAEADHYERLLRSNSAGAAWFRHRANAARAKLGEEARESAAAQRPPRPNEIDDAYELFSGGRAISENLQLDRVWQSDDAGERTIDVDSIPGISVKEYDWDPRVEGLAPELDPLASWIPADQHAVFFPSFAGLVAVLDESTRIGTPLLRVAEPRAEDARTRERYERQLCLELDAVARLMGPAVVRSVALTGSDPYLRTGSDVALLFDCSQPELLHAFLLERHRAAADAHADAAQLDDGAVRAELQDAGAVPDDEWAAVRTPDRRLSSHVLRRGETIVVGNSLAQIERLLATRADPETSLARAQEYVFFRDRYARGADDEAAFILLTDATIRRWCGPRWRIGAARRTQAAALLAEHQAAAVPELVAGAPPRALASPPESRGLGELTLGPRGAHSSVYGSADFLTPILELDVAQVTQQEKEAYLRFKNRYQQGWRAYFDPIAVRFAVGEGRVGMDVSVMPLIGGTDYAQLVEMTGDAAITAGAGDPHAEAILHYVMAVSSDSRTFGMGRDLAGSVVPGVDDPLGWVGDTVAFYFDGGPFWTELAEAEDDEEFFWANASRFPAGLHVAVANPLGLAGLLTSLRAFSGQAAPGMVIWENREHAEQTYVRIAPSEDFATNEFADFALHYVILPSGLTLSTNEDVIRRAIDRQAAGEPAAGAGASSTWLGESVALNLEQQAFEALLPLWAGMGYQRQQRVRSWSNLAILNEWHALFPDEDPVAVHEQLWGTRPVCPGGGEYVWNEEWRTMESTAYGHPAEPRDGPDLPAELRELLSASAGLTFEDDGLRARFALQR